MFSSKKQDNYIVRLVLTSFFGARMHDVIDENGNMEECLCIPLKRNNLKKNAINGKVSAYFFMTQISTPSQYGWTHYLKMKCDPDWLKKQRELGWDLKFAGNAKRGNYVVHKNEYNAKFVKNIDNE